MNRKTRGKSFKRSKRPQGNLSSSELQKRIDEALETGITTRSELAQAVGMSTCYTSEIIKQRGLKHLLIDQRTGYRDTYGPPIELFWQVEIQRLFTEYPRCIASVQHELGIDSFDKTKRAIHEAGYEPVGKREETRRAIAKGLGKGISPSTIAQNQRININYCQKLARKQDLSVPSEETLPSKVERKILRHRLERDHSDIAHLMLRGLTLEEIGKCKGVTREQIRIYGENTQTTTRRKHSGRYLRAAQHAESLRGRQEALLSILGQKVVQLSASTPQTWAERQTYLHIINRQNKGSENIPYQKILSLFQFYDDARQAGKEVSLKQMADHVGFSGANQARRILAKNEIRAMHWSLDRSLHHLAESEKTKLGEAFATTPLSQEDLRYFTGRSYHQISSLITQEKRASLFVYGCGQRKGAIRAGYALASQVYEAQDAGFTIEEVAQYVAKPQPMVEKLLTMRAGVEPEIVGLLQKLYPEQHPTTPYLSHYFFGTIFTPSEPRKRKQVMVEPEVRT